MIEDKMISVIIPVYNIEKYIEKNIESLLNQDCNGLELLYVDDGSKDGSCQILERYMEKNPIINIIHKENGGLSSARNMGLKHAKGKYILFVDGDDYIEKNSIGKLVDISERYNLDLLQCNYKLVSEDGTLISQNDMSQVGKVCTGVEWLMYGEIVYPCCMYLYKKEYMKNNSLLFKEGILHEDMEFTPRALMAAERMGRQNIYFYNYVQRGGSITDSPNIQRSFDLVRIAENFEDFWENKKKEIVYLKYFQEYIVYLYSGGIHLAIAMGIPLRELFKNFEIRDSILKGLSKSSNVKYKIMYVFMKYKLYWFYTILYKVKLYVKKSR